MGWAGSDASGAEESLPFFLPGWGLPGDGPAPVQELDSWGPGKLPASLKGPCLGGPTAPAPPLGSHNATADRSVFHHVLSPPFPQCWAGVHHLGARGRGGQAPAVGAGTPWPWGYYYLPRSGSRPWGEVGQGLLTCRGESGPSPGKTILYFSVPSP